MKLISYFYPLTIRHADGTEYEQRLQDEIDLDEKIERKQTELRKIEEKLEKEKRELDLTREKTQDCHGKLLRTRAQMRKMAEGVEKLTGKRVKRELDGECDEDKLQRQIETKKRVGCDDMLMSFPGQEARSS